MGMKRVVQRVAKIVHLEFWAIDVGSVARGARIGGVVSRITHHTKNIATTSHMGVMSASNNTYQSENGIL